MPSDLIRFPGDLITADLWNKMLGLIDGLNARFDAQEARVVPDVVGDLFPTALNEIAVSQLSLNTVFDVEGTQGNPGDAGLATRRVIFQAPPPLERVSTGTAMTLLITAPKADNPKAPKITGVTPATNAAVGQALDIAGSNFGGNLRVVIRSTQLATGEFNVVSPAQIHIAKVPPFEGSPEPGTSKAVPIIVGNEIGDSAFTVNFSTQATPAKPPRVTNLRLLNNTRLQILGTDLVQSDQQTLATMGGEERVVLPQTDGSLIIPLPAAMAAAYQALTPQQFKLLQTIDRNDVFKVEIGNNPFNNQLDRVKIPATPGSTLGRTTAGPILPGEIVITKPNLFGTTMKLYPVIHSPTTAGQIQNAKPVVSGNTVFIPGPFDAPIFSVDVTTLQDVSVVVKVGDKSTTFVAKFGSIPDKNVFDPRNPGNFATL